MVGRRADDGAQSGKAVGADRAGGHEIGNGRAQLLVVEIARRGKFVGKRRAVRAQMIEKTRAFGPAEAGPCVPYVGAGFNQPVGKRQPRIRMLT